MTEEEINSLNGRVTVPEGEPVEFTFSVFGWPSMTFYGAGEFRGKVEGVYYYARIVENPPRTFHVEQFVLCDKAEVIEKLLSGNAVADKPHSPRWHIWEANDPYARPIEHLIQPGGFKE